MQFTGARLASGTERFPLGCVGRLKRSSCSFQCRGMCTGEGRGCLAGKQELPGRVCMVSSHRGDSRIYGLEGKEVAWGGGGLETRNNGVC